MEFKTKKHTLKQILQLIMFFSPFFLPGGLSVILGTEAINYLFHGLKIAAILIFLASEKRPLDDFGNKTLLICVMMYGLAISTTNIIHGQNILAARHAVFFPFFCLMCIHYIKKNPRRFFEALGLLTGIYNLIQIGTVLLYYPNGVNHYTGMSREQTLAGAQYFFGGKNQAIYYMLLFLFSVAAKEYLKKSKIPKRIFFYIGIFSAELLLLDSANSIISLFIFICFYTILLLKVQNKFSVLFNPYIYLTLGIFIFVSVCILSMASTLLFSNVIFKLLGRNSTFTNRIYIWQAAIGAFKTSPLIGVGETELQILRDTAKQAHNIYLDIAYKYGLAGIIPYMFMLVLSCNKLSRMKNSFLGAMAVSIYFIMVLHNCFDAMDNYIFILLVCIYFNIRMIYGLDRKGNRIKKIKMKHDPVLKIVV